ncbi:ATP-binding protein [Gryllotalpicola reticulitermitis]|uniref:ATP-binding protein n=1 Tax=Gryllotalpicola reticulitermitis TaxID=1184153 RepID=A0ABV8QBW6_9MICO
MSNRDRTRSTVLIDLAGTTRRDRRQRQRAARQLLADAEETRRDLARQEREQERDTSSHIDYLPAAGEPGPAALRSGLRLRLPAHQDTSAALRGLYPFLAEGGLGAEGIFVGQDLYSGASFVYDPWVLYQRGLITAPNLVLAGIVGSGKSALAKALYTRSIPFGRRVYVAADPKGEHTPIARLVGGQAIILGHGMNTRLNPLDEGTRPAGIDDTDWFAQVSARRRDLVGALCETVLGRPLSPVEHTAVDVALRQTVAETPVPILPMVVDRILQPHAAEDPRLAEDGRYVGHALRRLVGGDLAGLFDGPSTVSFDPTLPMVSLDLSRVTENSTLISILMTCSSAWMEAALMDPHGGQRWVVYDEAWRLMSHPSLLRRMDAQWRLSRHYGIANLLIFHKLSDLDNVGDQGSAMRSLASSLLANAETRIIYRQTADQLGITADALGLTETERALLPGLGTGQGLWRIREQSFIVQHQLHASELAAFDTTTRMIANSRKFTNPEA